MSTNHRRPRPVNPNINLTYERYGISQNWVKRYSMFLWAEVTRSFNQHLMTTGRPGVDELEIMLRGYEYIPDTPVYQAIVLPQLGHNIKHYFNLACEQHLRGERPSEKTFPTLTRELANMALNLN